MYLVIPLSLILGSALAIAFIIWRKVPYIKKLATAENAAAQEGMELQLAVNFPVALFSRIAPELIEFFKKLKFHEYKEAWLIELEKFLRRLRLMSLRMDRLSDSLISRVRKGYQNGPAAPASDKEESAGSVKSQEISLPVVNELESLRKEEQRLIIEIAKNPKDSNLYNTLGDLYVKMGEYNDAKESFEAAMELDGQNAELKKKLSSVLEKLHTIQASQK